MTGRKAFPDKQVTISVGEPQNLGRSKNIKESIRALSERFKHPNVTPEKFHVYLKASDQEQRRLKGSAGWFIRTAVESGVRNRNSVKPSQLLTFDFDYCSKAFEKRLLGGEILPGFVMLAHTTRSHTPEKPRYRIIVPVKTSCPSERYQAASRIVAKLELDPEMTNVDKVSFRPAQMMYLPTCSKDMLQHYQYHEQTGDLFDWEAAVEAWEEDTGSSSYDFALLPRAAGEAELRETAEKAEDPLTKKGPVGDFCRAWSITDLVMGRQDPNGEWVDGPLSDFYEITEWHNGEASRMSYKHGSTSNGAVVYDDKFVFSHHGSDPVQEQLVNAYDLVRIHLYGDKDADAEPGTQLSRLPSAKAMKEWMRDDESFREQQAQSRYDLSSMLGDDALDESEDDEEDDEEEDDDGPSIEDLLGVSTSALNRNKLAVERRRRRAKKPDKGWIRNLDLTDDGAIKATIPNVATILKNDPRCFRRIAFNQLRQEIVLLDDIKTKTAELIGIACKDKVYGDRWQDRFDMTLQAILELPSPTRGVGYGLKVPDNMMVKGVTLAAMHNAFHPIKDFFDDVCEDDDGEITDDDIEFLETFLVRHAGAEDTAFVREATRMMAVASVARVEEPGCKFDYAIILEGNQGTGKSTLIKVLYGANFFGELSTDINNEQRTAEAMLGNWVMELPELSSLHKSDYNDVKAFLTRQRDDVRMAYGRYVSDLPRQVVFWGTTNDDTYLRDPTGNRRFWPIKLDGRYINPVEVMAERDRFWRIAVFLYRQMRAAQPYGDLKLTVEGEAQIEAEALQKSRRRRDVSDEWADQIIDWMDTPIRLREYLMEIDQSLALEETYKGYNVDETMVTRVAFTQPQALRRALGRHGTTVSNAIENAQWLGAVDLMQRDGWSHFRWERQDGTVDNRSRCGGIRARWIWRPDVTDEERSLGFRVRPEANTESRHPVDDGLDLL